MTYAIYFELSASDITEDYTVQALFVPWFLMPPETQHHPQAWMRTISKARIDVPWAGLTNSSYLPVDFSFDEPKTDIISHELGQLAGISSHLRGPLGDPGMKLRGGFPILLSEIQKWNIVGLNISSGKLPEGVISDIIEGRRLRGWPSLPGSIS